MKVLSIFVFAALILSMAACSNTGAPNAENEVAESKVFDYKAPPKSAPKLEVPPELTSYTGDDRYAIPGEGESGTRYSEFVKGGNSRKANAVLPPVRNVRMERSGTQRWLIVNDKAENIWPVIKAFWEENGLSISIDNPQAGILETEWHENKAKVPKDFFREYFGKVFSGLLASGERDQFHTRVERRKDGSSVEIYIVHYGLKEVETKDETGFKWISRPSDPELEATMLQLLMNKLGGGSGVLDKSQKSAKPDEKAATAKPKMNTLSDGSQSILLGETFDKSWRKVGLALEQNGIAVADKDRSKGIYYLSAGKEENNKQAADKFSRMQVVVKELASGCEVTVNTGAGANGGEGQKVLDSLFKTLDRI